MDLRTARRVIDALQTRAARLSAKGRESQTPAATRDGLAEADSILFALTHAKARIHPHDIITALARAFGRTAGLLAVHARAGGNARAALCASALEIARVAMQTELHRADRRRAAPPCSITPRHAAPEPAEASADG